MANQFFEFEWRVPVQGFEWVKVKPTKLERIIRVRGSEWVLVANPSPQWRYGEEPPRRTYEPLRESTGLFRQFVEVRQTKQGVLEFANKFGLLGTVPYIEAASESHPDEVRGEQLADWTKHIQALKDAVQVWDLVEKGDVDGLQQLQLSRQLFTNRNRIPDERFPRPRGDNGDDRSWDAYYHESPS